MDAKADFPTVIIRAAYGDSEARFEIIFNRYGGGNYQVSKASEKPGRYWHYGNCWFDGSRWICTHEEFTADDADAIGEAIERAYGIDKARNPLNFII